MDISDYTGKNIADRLSDQKQKALFWANWNQMRANYGCNVDAQLLNRQILLCEETYSDLYSPELTKTHYQPGSRPFLEQTVSSLVEGKQTQLEKTLQIMRFCRDLYRKQDGRLIFYGGTEEELIKKGEQLCECLARLMVALCEIAGIAGRIVTHFFGHLTCELFADGQWTYADPRTGIFYVKKDGNCASVRDLLCNPGIMESQPDWVKAECSARWTWEERNEKCKKFFFDKREINTIKPYSLSDCGCYRYEWLSLNDFLRNGYERCGAEYEKAIAENFGLQHGDSKSYFAFSIPEGVRIKSPLPVFTIPKNALTPPMRVRFLLDGIAVYETPTLCSPSELLTEYRGVFALFGTDGMLDPADYPAGIHELYAENPDCPAMNGSVRFEI